MQHHDVGVGAPGRTIRLTTRNAAGTQAVAGSLAAIAQPGDVLVLSGGFGAGKTTFTQGFVAALGIAEPVTSPTFAILAHYEGQPCARLRLVNHLDVYRLATLDEAEALGLDELLDGDAVTLIEWGEDIEALLPLDRVTVTMEPARLDEVAVGDDALDHRRIAISLAGRVREREPLLRAALETADASDDVVWPGQPC